MEVSMDTSPQGPTTVPAPAPAPAPAQTSTDLGTPRKRSLSAVDGEAHESNTNGPENQENSDPNAGDGNSENKSTGRAGASSPNKNTEQVDGAAGGDVNMDGDANGNTNTNGNGEKEGDSGSTTPAAKKRKVSPASKEIKQQEKEAREKQRADEKARKEEEKAKREEEKVKREEEKKAREEEKKKREAEREEEKKKREAEKEEEKKKREAEREEKKRVKDEERAAKEEERKKKEEEKSKKEQEKSKKERAQMRLNAFFAKPKDDPGASPSKSASGGGSGGGDNTATNEEAIDVVSDYQRAFPEFFLQSHTSVAPPHRFQRDSEALTVMRQRVDQALKASKDSSSSEPPVFRPSELFRLMPYQRRWGRQAASVKDLLLQIQNMGGSGDAVGTTEVKASSRRPQELLSKVRMKSLKFGEDVRPPYQGTFTRKVPQSSAQKIARNPFRRCLPDTNYDYDSEAEWEEPEEGEELDSEEEEEAEDDVDDDMDGFLDDEDEDQPADGKRRLIVGDLEPQSSGLCWQTGSNTVDPVLQAYKIETISDTVAFPIDPFSTVYWQKPKPSDAGASGTAAGGTGATGSTTDRSTLCARGQNANADASQQQHPGTGLALLAGTGKAKRGFPPEQLADFQEVVNGSDLTKMGLVEILKKRFPKVSKDVLKETLNSQATRVGSKESEKKWVCK